MPVDPPASGVARAEPGPLMSHFRPLLLTVTLLAYAIPGAAQAAASACGHTTRDEEH